MLRRIELGRVLRMAVLGSVVAGCLGAGQTAMAFKQGDRVVVIRAGVKLKAGSREVDDAVRGVEYTVHKVNGNWLWIGQGKPGWIKQQDVIPSSQAISYFTRQINRQPDDDGLHRIRGVLWLDLKQFDKAIEDLSTAIRIAPSNSAAHTSRAIHGTAKANTIWRLRTTARPFDWTQMTRLALTTIAVTLGIAKANTNWRYETSIRQSTSTP